MSDECSKPVNGKSWNWEAAVGHILNATPAFGGIVALIWLFVLIGPADSQGLGWEEIGQFGATVLIAFGVAALLRYALKPLLLAQAPAPIPSAASAEATRDRLGPIVLSIGTLAIAILAVALIIAFYELARRAPGGPVGTKIDTLLMGVFTAVLPVFATWVGTVLAFYFTKESFRQAAASALEAAKSPQTNLSAIERMIPYDNIGKIVQPRATVREIPMDAVFQRFNDNTTMVIVFDEKKQPVFIIRNKNPHMPATWSDKVTGAVARKDMKIDDYLKENRGENANDARKFGFIAQDATLERARAEMVKSGGTDLFVTATGQPTEPVIGWLPSDKLK